MEKYNYSYNNRKPIVTVAQFQNSISFPSDYIHTDARKFIQRYNLLNEFRQQVAEEERIENMKRHQFMPMKFAFYKQSDMQMTKQIKDYEESSMFTTVSKASKNKTPAKITDNDDNYYTQRLEETLKLDNQVKNVKKRMTALRDAMQIQTRPLSALEIKESLSQITNSLNSGREFSSSVYKTTQVRPHTASTMASRKLINSVNQIFLSQRTRPQTSHQKVQPAVTPIQDRFTPTHKDIKRQNSTQSTVIQ